MPVPVSYPGVYIQELPSGSHTITGVATSITAFVGRAMRGPLNKAISINSLADYERTFGGLDRLSPMSFAVRDFYANGGSRAVIVRLYRRLTAGDTPTALINVVTDPPEPALPVPLFDLVAANPGPWGKDVKVTVDPNVSEDVAKGLIPGPFIKGQVFNMTVRYGSTTEVHRNVTLLESTRRLDRVLLASSELVRWPPADPTDLVDDDAAALDTLAGNTLAGTVAGLLAVVNGKSTSTGPVQLGTDLTFDDFNKEADKAGLYALEDTDLFNILVVPPNEPVAGSKQTDGNLTPTIAQLAATYATKRRAMFILDPKVEWDTKTKAKDGLAAHISLIGDAKSNTALYFPRICYPNPFNDSQIEPFVPSGMIAGVMARTDAERGVWKAPAGLEAAITGASKLSVDLTDMENGELNPLGINCLRTKPGAGPVVWGARTLEGDDRLSSQWKYIPVRRTALFLEESLYRGTQWVVFEPNDEPLWSQIRTDLGAFMQGLFLQGAFQGTSPDEAYFVKCDSETTTQADINNGILNIIVGFAPLKPAEFVVISLQQMAGQTAGG